MLIVVAFMCPLSVSANSPALSYEDLIAISCEAFPEYAENIRNPDVRSVETYGLRDPVVIEETKTLSDGEIATYTELASGRAFLSFWHNWDQTSSSVSGTTTTKTGSLYVYCNQTTDHFVLNNFSYKINTSGYDSISNFGTYDFSTCNVVHGTNSVYRKSNENASGTAYARFDLTFEPAAAGVANVCRVVLQVGSNQMTLEVNGTTTVYS